MTKVFYAVFQEEMGGSELQGLTASPSVAISWVHELQKVYQMTHFDPIVEAPKGDVLRWEALYGSWEIRPMTVAQEVPLIPTPAPVELTLRLQGRINPNAQIEDLPEDLQDLVRAEQEAIGPKFLAFGVDEEVGWFVLHVSADLVYAVAVEREPDVDQT